VTALSRESRGVLIADFAGLARRAPIVAVAMTTFMVSLAGIPPTGGFWAKLVVFSAAVEAGGIGPTLAVVMLVNSVVSLYYYLAIPRQMIFAEVEGEPSRFPVPALVTGVVFLTTVTIIAVGVYPDILAKAPQLSTLVGGS